MVLLLVLSRRMKSGKLVSKGPRVLLMPIIYDMIDTL